LSFRKRRPHRKKQKLHGAHEVTLAEVDARTIPGKLRDAAARLFSPFL
jgi:hypothetical protein